MEVSAIKHMGAAGAHGRSPLLRLQSDERLVTLVRRGNQHAFEALVSRYQSRLLAFCRHMLSSREDAEDVLQEVFTAAFNAMLADERPINVRPWLYRIARNRSLNHLRRVQAIGVDSMDTHFSEGGISTAEKVHRREDFRLLVADVQELPETQKTALLLREIDALSYEQIAEAMDNTVPSVKSLLVRARVGLAEAAEARLLDCDVVRLELGEVAEGLKRISPPARRHLRTCDECASFRKQLVNTNRALAALMPVGPLLLLKKMLLAHVGTAAASGGSAAAGSTFGGALQIGISATAGKAAAGLAAAAIVTAGAVEVKHVTVKRVGNAPVVATSSEPVIAAAPSPPPAVAEPAAITPPPAPFALGKSLSSPASGDDDEAPKVIVDADRVRRKRDGAVTAGTPQAATEPAATGDVASSPVLTTGALPATADGKAMLLGVPVPLASAPTAVHTEVILHPGQVAMGTPAIGVVLPGTFQSGPVGTAIEVVPPPASAEPVRPPAPVTGEPPAASAGPGSPVAEPATETQPIPAPEAAPSTTEPGSEPVTPPAPVTLEEPAAVLPEPQPAPAPELPAPTEPVEPAAEEVEAVPAETTPPAA